MVCVRNLLIRIRWAILHPHRDEQRRQGGTTATVKKYRNLLKNTKQAKVGQLIILSGILPVFGSRSQGYRNSRRMAVNGMVQQLCREEEMGFVDLWDSFVGREEMYYYERWPAS